MHYTISLHIEKLPEGVYLATSDDVQGLVAEGRTIAETLAIARDVAKEILSLQGKTTHLIEVQESFDYPLIVEL
jgi:predicted RNase H-like HicB family nuclease